MNIVKLTPNASGGFPPIQTWSGNVPPEGYAEVACNTDVFYQFRGFVLSNVTDGVVTEFVGNQSALDAYLSEHPDTVLPPPPSTEDRITAIEDVLLGIMLGI